MKWFEPLNPPPGPLPDWEGVQEHFPSPLRGGARGGVMNRPREAKPLTRWGIVTHPLALEFGSLRKGIEKGMFLL